MRPTSKWAEMTELSYTFTKKQQKVSSDEAKDLGVGEFMAR